MSHAAQYVYVVSAGERGEGHDPVVVWKTLAEALDDAERMCGQRPTHVGGVRWKATLHNGVDEWYVIRFSVRGAR